MSCALPSSFSFFASPSFFFLSLVWYQCTSPWFPASHTSFYQNSRLDQQAYLVWLFFPCKKTDRPVLIYFEFVVCWWPRNSSPEHSSTTASRASPNATAIGVWRSKTASRAGPWPSFTTSTLPYLLSYFLLVLLPKSSIPTFSCAIYNSLLFFWKECVWSPIASSSRVISSLKSAMARDVWGRNRLIPCCYCWALTTCVSMTRAGWKSALRFNTFIYWA